MASRRRAREFALQALYAWDQNGGAGGSRPEPVTRPRDVSRTLGLLWETQVDADGLEGKAAVTNEMEFAGRLATGVEQRQADIDGLIEAASVNWRLVRMPVVDRNILRLAGYELLACHDIPASVSINEAVELAKRFGDKESRAFVNGILDRIASETGRGGRRHGKGGGRGKGGRGEGGRSGGRGGRAKTPQTEATE